MFDSRLLNKDIPQSDKLFAKRNDKLRNITKYINQSSSNCQIEYNEPKHTINQITPEFHSCIHAKYC